LLELYKAAPRLGGRRTSPQGFSPTRDRARCAFRRAAAASYPASVARRSEMDSIRALRLRCVACCTAIVRACRRGAERPAPASGKKVDAGPWRPARRPPTRRPTRRGPRNGLTREQRKEATLQARQEGGAATGGRSRRSARRQAGTGRRCRQRSVDTARRPRRGRRRRLGADPGRRRAAAVEEEQAQEDAPPAAPRRLRLFARHAWR
jgi:hypothetical protein